jgi:lipoprotein-anchoring transpeptidase ErfK/SrfK
VRDRPVIIAVVFLAVLVLAGAGAVIYDSTRNDLIAKGVTVGGVDVGGLRADQARTRLQDELLTPLNRAVTVRAARRTFELTPAEARIRADIDGMVDAAVQRSRSGSIFTRVARSVTGGEVHASLPAQIAYDSAAVNRLVAHIKKTVSRPPRDADVKLSANGPRVIQGHNGRAIDPTALTADIERRIVKPGPRTVLAAVRSVEPTVTTRDLGKRYPWMITVDRKDFRLTVYRRLHKQKTYRVAVGQVGLETPAGLYHVQNKAINPAWHVPNSAWAGKLAGKTIPSGDPENPIKARWLGIFDGAGIHGTDELSSLGSAASHGCIRMAIPDVEEVYDEVPVGAPVYIA